MTQDHANRYRALVQRSGRPSIDQMHEFARFLSTDHSWYKKLPVTGPGEPFFVFLDPHVQQVRIRTETETTEFRDIVSVTNRSGFRKFLIDMQAGDIAPEMGIDVSFEASATTTATWWERMGRWRYWNWGGPGQPRREALAQAAEQLRVLDDDGSRIIVPSEVLDLGLVYLQATVSPMFDTSAKSKAWRAENPELFARDEYIDQIDSLVNAMERVAGWFDWA